MKFRIPILLLLSLTLASSGCATGTHTRRTGGQSFDLNHSPKETGLARSADFKEAEFGLIENSLPAHPSPSVSAPSFASVRRAHGKATQRNPINASTRTTKNLVSVSYLEDEQERSLGAAKIEFSAVEDDESDSDSSEQSCCDVDIKDDEELGDDALSDSASDLSPSPSLPFESEFAPTAWAGITIDQVREMAYEYHPVTARAQAKLDALRGRYLQKGLPNNPRIGINADDVNEGGNGGRWGVQFGRQVVRGGKRQSDQAIVCAEVEVATEELKLAQGRLDTDIATRFYDCMVAQEQVAMAERMQSLANRATELSRKLYAAQEVTRSSVLQAELELEKATVTTRRLENRHLWAKRQLAALLGEEELPTVTVGGSIDDVSLEQNFEATYDRLLKHSPELSVLFADIERSRRVASRERLETITDLTWQTTVQYDTVEDRLIGGFQMTWQIPTLNQNQGAIYEAERNVAVGQHTADIKALDIRQRLSSQWQQYVDAKLQVDAFRDSILPKSQEAVELLMKGYEVGETELLEVLVAQRTFFQTQVAYLENVRSLSLQNARIRGMLLGNSLSR